MAFIPVANAARVSVEFTLNGVTGKSYILHMAKTAPGGITSTDLETLANAMSNWVSIELVRSHSTAWQCNGLKLRSLLTQEAPAFEVSYPTPVPGTRPTAILPNNVSIAVHKGSAAGGRSAAGRVYHTSLTEGDVTGNFISTTVANLILNSWQDLAEYTQPVGFLPCIVSYWHNKAPRVNGLVHIITSWTLRDLKVDTNRRRLF